MNVPQSVVFETRYLFAPKVPNSHAIHIKTHTRKHTRTLTRTRKHTHTNARTHTHTHIQQVSHTEGHAKETPGTKQFKSDKGKRYLSSS